MEMTSLNPSIINDGVDPWNLRGALPEIGFLPILRKAFRLEEKDIGLQTTLTVGHEQGQFTEARARAGAVWVNQHDQRLILWGQLDLALNRPLLRRLRRDARSIFITA